MEPEEHTVAKLIKSATGEIRSVAKLIHYLIEGFLLVPYFICFTLCSWKLGYTWSNLYSLNSEIKISCERCNLLVLFVSFFPLNSDIKQALKMNIFLGRKLCFFHSTPKCPLCCSWVHGGDTRLLSCLAPTDSCNIKRVLTHATGLFWCHGQVYSLDHTSFASPLHTPSIGTL